MVIVGLVGAAGFGISQRGIHAGEFGKAERLSCSLWYNDGMQPLPSDKKPLPESVLEELVALAEMSDEDIDYSDVPETKDEDWANAVRGKFYRPDTQFKFKEN